MNLNRDLFGNLIPEPPAAVPVTVRIPDYVISYHSSWYRTPPHRKEDVRSHLALTSNQSPGIIHMGTLESAMERRRDSKTNRILHAYKIPKSLLDVVHKDSDAPSPSINYHGPLQQSLWENVIKRPQEIEQGGLVVPYLNQFEDQGSVSYMVPKHLIHSGDVEYLGIQDWPAHLKSKRV